MASYDELTKHLSNIPDVGFGAPIKSRHNLNGWQSEDDYAMWQAGYAASTLNKRYGEVDWSKGEEDLSDISGLPFSFNPPLHKWNQPKWLGNPHQDYGKMMNHWLRETGASGGLRLTELTQLRLGRITMGNKAQTFASVANGVRYGFRFLYNPAAVGGSQTISKNVIPNAQEKAMWYILDGLETIQFTVLLNRIPDVNVPNVSTSDYNPTISAADLRGIKSRGTNWDLEFLFRCSNGAKLTTADGQDTADYGVISPNPLFLTLGNMQFYGRMVSVHARHQIFSLSMVPILTEVDIAFTRIVALSQEDAEAYASGGGKSIGVEMSELAQINKRREELGLNPLNADGSTSGEAGSGGFPLTEVDYKVANLDAEQKSIARVIVLTAMASFTGTGPHGPDGKRAALIGLITAYQESKIRNLDHGHGTSVGVFQQIDSGAWGTKAQRMNVQLSTAAFFGVDSHASANGLRDIRGWNSMTVTQASHAVQRSAYPNAVTQWISPMTVVRDTILKEEGLA